MSPGLPEFKKKKKKRVGIGSDVELRIIIRLELNLGLNYVYQQSGEEQADIFPNTLPSFQENSLLIIICP